MAEKRSQFFIHRFLPPFLSLQWLESLRQQRMLALFPPVSSFFPQSPSVFPFFCVPLRPGEEQYCEHCAALPLEELMSLAGEQKQTGYLFIKDALAALKSLDPAILDHEFERALQSLGRLELIDGFVFPFLSEARRAVENGTLRPAHLSFAHGRLRDLLGILASSVTVSDDAPRVVLASAPGLEHEPGLLGSAMYAAASGWRPIRFSPGTPAEELAFAAVANRARALVYSIVPSSQTSAAIGEATMLRRLAPPEVVVMFGGRLDAASSDALIGAGLERIRNMSALRLRLEAIAGQDTNKHSSS